MPNFFFLKLFSVSVLMLGASTAAASLLTGEYLGDHRLTQGSSNSFSADQLTTPTALEEGNRAADLMGRSTWATPDVKPTLLAQALESYESMLRIQGESVRPQDYITAAQSYDVAAFSTQGDLAKQYAQRAQELHALAAQLEEALSTLTRSLSAENPNTENAEVTSTPVRRKRETKPGCCTLQ